VGLHCNGVKPLGCHDKFHLIAKQNVIGSARIVCLCFYCLVGLKHEINRNCCFSLVGTVGLIVCFFFLDQQAGSS